jgi:hypothetical protein
MAAATMAVSPAAGPLTLNWEPLSAPITIPPIIPAIRPLNKGAFEASATPKQSGSATKNTTIEAGKSDPACLNKFNARRAITKYFVCEINRCNAVWHCTVITVIRNSKKCKK